MRVRTTVRRRMEAIRTEVRVEEIMQGGRITVRIRVEATRVMRDRRHSFQRVGTKIRISNHIRKSATTLPRIPSSRCRSNTHRRTTIQKCHRPSRRTTAPRCTSRRHSPISRTSRSRLNPLPLRRLSPSITLRSTPTRIPRTPATLRTPRRSPRRPISSRSPLNPSSITPLVKAAHSKDRRCPI